jgi:hypothetical protein
MVQNKNKSMNPALSRVRHIETATPLSIGPTDGTQIIAHAHDVFKWIDNDFSKCDAGCIWQPTSEIFVGAYEQTGDGDFPTIFGSVERPLDSLCFTQPQIRNFCVTHPEMLLPNGYGTLFLFKSGGVFFIALVLIFRDELGAHRYPFSYPRIWHAERKRRLIIP